jgi:hypothetical protein
MACCAYLLLSGRWNNFPPNLIFGGQDSLRYDVNETLPVPLIEIAERIEEEKPFGYEVLFLAGPRYY